MPPISPGEIELQPIGREAELNEMSGDYESAIRESYTLQDDRMHKSAEARID